MSERDVAKKVAAPMFGCLAAIHSSAIHIVHRDVKLENLVIAHGCVKLIDFGLALDMTSDAGALDVGTLGYQAPELLGANHKYRDLSFSNMNQLFLG